MKYEIRTKITTPNTAPPSDHNLISNTHVVIRSITFMPPPKSVFPFLQPKIPVQPGQPHRCIHTPTRRTKLGNHKPTIRFSIRPRRHKLRKLLTRCQTFVAKAEHALRAD